jgi:hypothetical protein
MMRPDRRQVFIALGVILLSLVVLALTDFPLAPENPPWDSTIGPHPR